ncbi:siderophore iron transporter mirB [Cordyceps javanica]|uniref:Siderophore iron transporter mirB n=1 Tax=Cordyceps javanica TaxID=43265 RepID=A0A545VF83_9HYPO|nr:siderophore iron transporter mirB [Cordyceps javanica]TQW11464.1 siderophore iron transporter mirB [Cordyceps javanica]
MGHSTGSQCVLNYLSQPNPISAAAEFDEDLEHCLRLDVDGAIMQAPVSDREAIMLVLRDGFAGRSSEELKSIWEKAEDFAKETAKNEPQSIDTLIPLWMTAPIYFNVPISVRRFLSLTSPDSPHSPGEDDMFSSDLPDEVLAKTFGMIAERETKTSRHSASHTAKLETATAAMRLTHRFQNVLGSKSENVTEDPNAVNPVTEKETTQDVKDTSSNDEERVNPDLQNGVEKIEAVTLAWSRGSLYLILVLIWFLTLVNNLKSVTIGALTPFATSSFAASSLLTVIQIVGGSMGSAVYIPMAKALDLWGRAEGFLLMMSLSVIGVIVLASSTSLPAYCAGYVFYLVGFNGLVFSWDVLATDVTNLRNRGLAFAFTSSPAVISAFAGPNIAQAFYKINWRWGYGCWAIIVPVFAVPIYLLLAWNLSKAKKQGIIAKKESGRKFNAQTLWWFVTEFDLVGVFLFAGGLVVFLLPFTLARTAPEGWKTPYIIAMIVVGFVVLVAFALYESFMAPVPFLSRRFLTDRSILGACLLNMTYQISYYCYASYLQPFLMVVYNVDLPTAGYVANTFSACAFIFLFLTGWLIRWSGRFKWILWICVPLYIFGLGLMIHFRTPGGHIGYIVMCEIFFSASGSVFILCCQLAVLAAVDHQHVASALSLLFSMGGIGGAIGSAISGAIWTNTFYPQLQKNLPAADLGNLTTIYSMYTVQLSYPWGSPTRDAIVKSYGYAQPRMLAAGTAFMALGFLWVGMIKNMNVKKMKQTKGNVL